MLCSFGSVTTEMFKSRPAWHRRPAAAREYTQSGGTGAICDRRWGVRLFAVVRPLLVQLDDQAHPLGLRRSNSNTAFASRDSICE